MKRKLKTSSDVIISYVVTTTSNMPNKGNQNYTNDRTYNQTAIVLGLFGDALTEGHET